MGTKDEAARRLSAGIIDLFRVIEQLRNESAARQGFSDKEFRVLLRIAGSEEGIDLPALEEHFGGDVHDEVAVLLDSGHVAPLRKASGYAATATGAKVARTALDGLTTTISSALGPTSDDEAMQLVLLIDLTTRMLAQSLETRD